MNPLVYMRGLGVHSYPLENYERLFSHTDVYTHFSS